MTPALPPDVAALLDEAIVVTVATGDAAGPWAAPVFFAVADATLLFVSSARSRHCSEAALAGAVAFAVHPAAASWDALRGVQGSGQIEPVAAGEQEAARAAYLDRFAAIRRIVEAPAGPQQGRVREAFLRNAFFLLRPDRLRLIDNRQGFATRREYLRSETGWIAG
ncbi:pyridoxamine 5'-phosphate oxidase family protein [Sphingomonas canadensis]|uniref:Pyridoxamine 5'-phosphate oxidase family protein n=1 Tax=Sphingomonas canadensis TaxID=1219257 RepID=A0ABW3H4Q0_9SPHN|nr:pyridoxamine 5'-phosphate oxidase family protein [Sphingomonas canadensis]MCW3836191.1 pyridoxamine 5'-phosphate oxidase family protein [Sphingomonas canadensis]